MAKISKNAKKLLALTLAGVMTVGTAVPGAAMSTVQEVKAATDDFKENYTTSVQWINRFNEIFQTLYVGSENQVVTDEEYIGILAKGDDYPNGDIIEEAIWNQLTAEEQAEFSHDHYFSVKNVNEIATDDTWRVTISVVFDRTLAANNGDAEGIINDKDALEKEASESYVAASAGTADFAGKNEVGEGTSEQNWHLGIQDGFQKGLDVTTAEDVKADLIAFSQTDGFPSFAIEENDGADQIKARVVDAYDRALQILGYAGKFEATIGDDPIDSFVQDGKWYGVLTIGNNHNNDGKLQPHEDEAKITDLEITIPSSYDLYQEAAEYVQSTLENSETWVPFGTSTETSLATEELKNTILNKVIELANVKLYSGHKLQENDVTFEGTPNITSFKDHSAKLTATVRIGQGNLSKKVVLDGITIKEDLIDGFTLTSAITNNSQEYEIASEGLYDNGQINSVTVHQAHLGDKIVNVADFDNGDINPYFQVKTDYNKNKLGTYTYNIISNDDRTPAAGDLSYQVKVVRKGSTNIGSMAKASSDKPEVAKANTDGTYTIYSKGEAVLSYTDADGKTVKYKVAVADDKGTHTCTQIISEEPLTIANNANNLGFVYHDGMKNYSIKVTDEDVDDETSTSDKVVDVTFDENKGLVITPLAVGTAVVEITGGMEKGNLKTIVRITVDAFGAITYTTEKNVTGFKLDQSALSTVKAAKFYENEYVTVGSCGFSDEDKLIIYAGSLQDTVPASDLQNVFLNTVQGTGSSKMKFIYANGLEATYDVSVYGQLSFDIADLGLYASEVRSLTDTASGAGDYITNKYVSVEIDNGIVTVKRISDTDNGRNEIVVADEDGNLATIYVTTVGDLGLNCDKEKDIQPFDKLMDADFEFIEPTKDSYFIGEELDVTGGMIKLNDSQGITLKSYMVTGFDSSKSQTLDLVVAYGGISATYKVRIKPQTTTIDTSSLGLANGETVKVVTPTGDEGISVKLDGTKMTITSTKINQSGAIIVETSTGNKLAVKVNVDEKGEITTDIVKTFASSTKGIANDEETLNLIGTVVESSNAEVATVKIANGNVEITSLKPGTTTITVSDGEKEATIEVTVDDFGNIDTTIYPYSEEGFHRVGNTNDWYYILNGKKVINDWVGVTEADPYNGGKVGTVWYHFDKDGLMQRGWIEDETGWKTYNLDSNGRMRHDMWLNAEEQADLDMPAGMYYVQSDGAVQMNGWAESVTPGIFWFCNAGTGLFEVNNPASWANAKLW